MKICFTISSLHCGGAERVISTLANSFSLDGHDVSIIMVSVGKSDIFYELNHRIKVVPLLKDRGNPRFFRRVKLLKESILTENPDIVISFLPHICIYTFFALKGTKIPIICSERNDPNLYSLLKKTLLKHVFSKSNGCVFQTNDSRKFYKRVKEEKSVIIPNPVFLTTSTISEQIEENNKFISVGRLEKQKNYSFLIDSFYEFHKLYPNYSLGIYGEGSLKTELEDQIRCLSADDYIRLAGVNNNWHEEAIKCKAFISSSLHEGMPNCLEEALCLGCRCIATDCPIGGSKDLVNLLNSGVLVETNNKEQMIQALTDIANNKIVKKIVNYDMLKPENIAKKWYTFIERIVGDKNKDEGQN